MTRFIRRVSRKLFIIATIGTVAVFLLACFTPFVHPARFWWIAVLGVGFPLLTLALVLLVFLWWFFKSRWAFPPLLALLLGWGQITHFFAFHPFSSFSQKKEAGTFRVMQWNVARLDAMNRKRPGGTFRQHIFDFIKDMDPDIICMEEFLESNNPKQMPENISYMTDTLHYPYYYFARDHKRWDNVYEHGVAVFSRYPLVDTLRIRYYGEDPHAPGESLIHVDVNIGGQRTRIFATHLQSLRFDGNDYNLFSKIATAEDSGMVRSKGVVRKFRRAYTFRSKQAELVRRELDNSPYPLILCGDFNDVPNSFTWSRIKGDRTDAFLRRGFGVGRSFASLSPTLRIDYIFCSKDLEVTQFKKTVNYWSDHFPLVADFKLPSKE
ncbi:MAG TPA: endonuclease/exonuclease/phosphatase family protein [Chitinophagaceae bacterium]|nr:endonuclease/exonuclease/phosphatase family protein [Chitinophagaceae bacterium]